MSDTITAVVLGFFTLASCVWVGGYIAIAVVARTAAATLDAGQRVAFFRALGRSYVLVGTPALIVALGTGAALLTEHDMDGTTVAAIAVAAVLVVSFAIAVVQARRMTRLRRRALADPEDARLAGQVATGARAATALRAALGLLSLALIALGSLLAT